jgi:hypothetical protein
MPESDAGKWAGVMPISPVTSVNAATPAHPSRAQFPRHFYNAAEAHQKRQESRNVRDHRAPRTRSAERGDRCLINLPMLPNLKLNADGSVAIYVQNKSPGPTGSRPVDPSGDKQGTALGERFERSTEFFAIRDPKPRQIYLHRGRVFDRSAAPDDGCWQHSSVPEVFSRFALPVPGKFFRRYGSGCMMWRPDE